MDYHNFENLVSSTILERGRNYFKGRFVTSLEETFDGWIAEVEGSDIYEVELEGKNRLRNWYCDCPYDYGDTCKHVVAVLYAVREQGFAGQSKKKTTGTQQLDKIFKEVPHKELLAFFRENISRNKDLKNKFLMEFADVLGGKDVSDYIDLVNKIVQANKGRDGYIEYKEEGKLAKQMGALVNKAGKAIEKNDFLQAFNIHRALLDVLPHQLEWLTSSRYELHGTIRDAQRIAESILLSDASIDFKENVLSALLDYYVVADNDYGDIDDIPIELVLQYYKGILSYETIEQAYHKKIGRIKHEYQEERMVRMLINLYREHKEFEKIDELRRSYLHLPEVRRELVERYIETEDYERAKKIILSGIELAEAKQHPGVVNQWKEILLDIAQREQNKERIIELLREKYYDGRGHNIEVYEMLRKAFDEELAWEIEKETIFKNIKKGHNTWEPNTWLAKLYEEEGMFLELLEMVQKEDKWGQLLNQYHLVLLKYFPDAVIDLLIPKVWEMAEKLGRGSYKELAVFLLNLKNNAHSRIFATKIAQEIREKYRSRPAMQEELRGI